MTDVVGYFNLAMSYWQLLKITEKLGGAVEHVVGDVIQYFSTEDHKEVDIWDISWSRWLKGQTIAAHSGMLKDLDQIESNYEMMLAMMNEHNHIVGIMHEFFFSVRLAHSELFKVCKSIEVSKQCRKINRD